jgi:ribosomal protein L7/L12
MTYFLSLLLLLQPPGKKENSPPPTSEPVRPSIAKLWPKLTDLKAEQTDQLKKIMADYAAQIAEIEAERDSKLAAILSTAQREALAAIAAEAVDRYRVVLQAKFNRPGQLFKPFKEILGLDPNETSARLDAAPNKPVAENLSKAKADALVKTLNAAGAKAVAEKQEDK